MEKKKKANIKNKKKNNSIFSSDNEMAKLILLIIIVAAAFALFYVITSLVVKNKDKTENKQENNEVVIQYEKILVSNILSQNNTEYYVLAYTSNDSYLDAYKNYLLFYETSKQDAVPYYFVELDNTFNKGFISEKSNLNVDKSENFKFSQTTLLRIKDGKVISTYEGKENITGKLGRMTK